MDEVTQSTLMSIANAATSVNGVILAIAGAWVLNKAWVLLRRAVSGKGG